MKQLSMEEIKLFSASDNEVPIMDSELTKSTIKKIQKKELKEKLFSIKTQRKINLQGKEFWRLLLLTCQIKLKNTFSMSSLKKIETQIEQLKNSAENKQELNELTKKRNTIIAQNDFIEKVWKERKVAKENYGSKYKKLEKSKVLNEYHSVLATKLKKFHNDKQYIKKNKLLISRDGLTHVNKFANLSVEEIAKIKSEAKLVSNQVISNKLNINKRLQKIRKIEDKLKSMEILARISYENEFKYKIENSKLNHLVHLNESIEKHLAYKSKCIEKLKSEDKQKAKEKLKNDISIAAKDVRKNLSENFLKLIKFKIKYKIFKEQREMYRNELKSIKLNSAKNIEYYKLKIEIKNSKVRFQSENRKLKLEHKAEIIEIYEKTPVKYGLWKLILATSLTVLMPGIGTIVNKQYIKGLIQLLVSMFSWVLLLYAFGIGNIEGEGILGLIDLGHADNVWEMGDARYYIIEGSLSVLFVTIIAIWNIFNANAVYKISKANLNGARVRTWVETKNYFSDIGYPVMTSIPSLIMMLVVVMIPIVTTFLLAFTNYKPNNASNFQWDGLERFKEILTPAWAKTMWTIASWSMVWTFITWFSAFVIALTLATSLNNKRVKGKLIFRIIYVLPWAIPGFITILLFKIMFLPGSILSNFFGNDTFQSVPLYAKISVIMIQMWSGYCVNLVLITGILQSIPTDLYEAADIDGATNFSKMFKITLPLIIYQMTPILVGQFMGAFNNFGIIYLYLDGGPYFTNSTLQGGAGSTETIASLIYKLISAGKAGIASAMNVIVSGVMVAISVTILLRSKSVKGGVS